MTLRPEKEEEPHFLTKHMSSPTKTVLTLEGILIWLLKSCNFLHLMLSVQLLGIDYPIWAIETIFR